MWCGPVAPVAVMRVARSESRPAAANCLNWESDLHLREASVVQQNSWQTCEGNGRDRGLKKKGWDGTNEGEIRRDGTDVVERETRPVNFEWIVEINVLKAWQLPKLFYTSCFTLISVRPCLTGHRHRDFWTQLSIKCTITTKCKRWNDREGERGGERPDKKSKKRDRRRRLAVTSCF